MYVTGLCHAQPRGQAMPGARRGGGAARAAARRARPTSSANAAASSATCTRSAVSRWPLPCLQPREGRALTPQSFREPFVPGMAASRGFSPSACTRAVLRDKQALHARRARRAPSAQRPSHSGGRVSWEVLRPDRRASTWTAAGHPAGPRGPRSESAPRRAAGGPAGRSACRAARPTPAPLRRGAPAQAVTGWALPYPYAHAALRPPGSPRLSIQAPWHAIWLAHLGSFQQEIQRRVQAV